MKLAYLDLCGFRGYRKQLRLDFSDDFTIIDGRNGVGKSTIFDAVEFALTGTITKYGSAKADGETVADYLWWSGEGPAPVDRYVEVGFRDDKDLMTVRRTQLAEADAKELSEIRKRLCDANAPESPLPQLCITSIIRDEHIAALSLDMTETERYSLLRDAVGATDAEAWIDRGSRLVSVARKRVQTAEREVEEAAREMAAATRRVDEIRATLVEEGAIAAAAARLQTFANSSAAIDQLTEPARASIVGQSRQVDLLAALEATWLEADEARAQLPQLEQSVSEATAVRDQADATYTALVADGERSVNSGTLAQQARDLDLLVTLGRRLGMHDGHCPLCASDRTPSDFERGLTIAENYARKLDAQAVEEAERERAREAAVAAAASAKIQLKERERALQALRSTISEFELRFSSAGLPMSIGINDLRERQKSLRAALDVAREDLRIIETLKLNAGLEKALHQEAEAKVFYARAEARLGLARRAEVRAQSLHDAARRAAGETLDRRLERVLPLMSELYRRLRPHPVWSDIEYKVRGDVRRFLKLQVGNELNPQFIFSSGQRRATGLAFLLAVNLSLSWSRWRTILLDDPVQHVDDFRSVHLVEVLAQLSRSGKQIICAVEDAALADLLSRRLPVEDAGKGRRVTLGPDSDGALIKLAEQELGPLPREVLVTGPQRLAS